MYDTTLIANNKTKRTKTFYCIYVPLIIIFILNLCIFILSSFYDLQISDIFSAGLRSRFLTLYSQFYHFAGYTELYIPFLVFLFFCAEYASRHFWKEVRVVNKMRWIWFGAILVIWLGLFSYKFLGDLLSPYSTAVMINNIVEIMDFDFGFFISGTDFKIIISSVMVYQFIFLILCLLLLKKKVIERPDFIRKQYWINAIELLIFFIVSYFVVGTTKVLMGRNYYKSIDYVREYRIQLFSELNGININSIISNLANVEYQSWWVPNGLIGNFDKIWNILKNDIGTLFTANAFPSGHMAATGVVGYLLFSFIFKDGEGNKTELSKVKILLFWIFILHMWLMFFSFLINGSHWASDLSFSWMWVIISIAITQAISMKLRKKYKQKNLL